MSEIFELECEEIDVAHTIMGVKQVPLGSLLPGKTYCFFSHTIKAQQENMTLLDEVLQKNVRLIDYECIASETADNPKPVRQVAFGTFAGRAGMIDALRMVGESFLKNKGVTTPFLNISSAYMYSSYEAALNEVQVVGQLVKESFYFHENPLLFCFTGYGNVTKGALEVFEKLQPTLCSISDLEATLHKAKSVSSPESKIIGCQLEKHDLVERKGTKQFYLLF